MTCPCALPLRQTEQRRVNHLGTFSHKKGTRTSEKDIRDRLARSSSVAAARFSPLCRPSSVGMSQNQETKEEPMRNPTSRRATSVRRAPFCARRASPRPRSRALAHRRPTWQPLARSRETIDGESLTSVCFISHKTALFFHTFGQQRSGGPILRLFDGIVVVVVVEVVDEVPRIVVLVGDLAI